MIRIKIKKLHTEAKSPKMGTYGAACWDLAAATVQESDGVLIVGTGLAMEIPHGYVGRVYMRSSVAKYDLILSNAVGIIDSDYRGEIMAKFRTLQQHEGFPNYYQVGEWCLQICFEKVLPVEFEEVEILSETERGEGGYGSTGN